MAGTKGDLCPLLQEEKGSKKTKQRPSKEKVTVPPQRQGKEASRFANTRREKDGP